MICWDPLAILEKESTTLLIILGVTEHHGSRKITNTTLELAPPIHTMTRSRKSGARCVHRFKPQQISRPTISLKLAKAIVPGMPCSLRVTKVYKISGEDGKPWLRSVCMCACLCV